MKYIIVFAFIGLIGCSSPSVKDQTSSLPDWVTDLPIKSGWLYGVGSAELSGNPALAAKLARQRARLDLIRGLETNIQGQMLIQTTDENGEVNKRVSESVKSSVAEIKLLNVELLSSETVNNNVFVLVGLQRQKEVAALNAQLGEISSSANSWDPAFEINIAELRKLVHWHQQKIEWLQIKRKVDIVAGSPQQIGQPPFFERLSHFMVFLQENVLIQYKAQSDTQVSGWASNADKGNLVIELDIHNQSDLQDGTHYYFITGSIVIYDLVSDEVVKQPIEIRGISSIQSKALQNAKNQLDTEVRNFIAQVLPDTETY